MPVELRHLGREGQRGFCLGFSHAFLRILPYNGDGETQREPHKMESTATCNNREACEEYQNTSKQHWPNIWEIEYIGHVMHFGNSPWPQIKAAVPVVSQYGPKSYGLWSAPYLTAIDYASRYSKFSSLFQCSNETKELVDGFDVRARSSPKVVWTICTRVARNSWALWLDRCLAKCRNAAPFCSPKKNIQQWRDLTISWIQFWPLTYTILDPNRIK